jgi:hypothetical protein
MPSLPENPDKFTHVKRAFTDFLKTNATLVTLTGHVENTDPRIAGLYSEQAIPDTGVFIYDRPSRPFIETEVDTGLWITSFHLLLRHKTEQLKVYRMLGLIQEMVKRNQTTYQDVSYNLHANVFLESIRWSADRSNAPHVQQNDGGIYWTDAFIIVRWREKEIP